MAPKKPKVTTTVTRAVKFKKEPKPEPPPKPKKIDKRKTYAAALLPVDISERQAMFQLMGGASGVRYYDYHLLAPVKGSWRPEEIADLQNKLYEAGYITKTNMKKVALGQWDKISYAAYKQAAISANLAGSSIGAILTSAAAMNAAMGRDGRGRGRGRGRGGGQEILVTNADDLRRLFEEVSPSVIGYKLNAPQVENLIKTYQDLERKPPLGSQPPTPETFIKQKTREAAPTAAGAHDIANQFQNFLSIIGKAGGF